MTSAQAVVGVSVFPTMVLLDESTSKLRCRILSGPTHVLRRRAHRLGRLVCGVPGVIGVRETIDGVLIECDAEAGDKRSIRDAVQAIYSLIASGVACPTSQHADD